jgi:hypothetical protein
MLLLNGSVILISLIALVSAPLNQRATQPSQTQSALIDGTKPGAFMTFEKAGVRKARFQGESDKGIWFRLHNNYRFPIEVTTQTMEEGPPEVAIMYDIVSACEKGKLMVPSASHGDVFTGFYVEPGRDVLFSIPAEDLPKTSQLLVRFEIKFETNGRKSAVPPLHYAVFDGWLLPEGVNQKE